MKRLVKSVFLGISSLLTLPLALLSAFGRIESAYLFGAHCCASIPGLPGDYLRIAYCRWTLQACGAESRLEFGSFFAHSQASIGSHVYIGPYCVLGKAEIGDRTQIGSGVQILSGARQHSRDAQGRILGSHSGDFTTVAVGADCWIGAGAILMAPVGEGSTIGAGAVVTKPIPPRSVAFGVPARVKD